MTDILSVKGLSVDLGEFSLKDVSFSVSEGAYCCLLGASGAGKSVLLETIMGGFRPKKGKVYLRGVDVTRWPPEKRKLGIVYQDYVLFPHLNVFDNIAFGLRDLPLSRKERDEKVKGISRQLHISDLLHRDISTLSGGEQQRTALARAVITEPEILLMDEAFSALDLSSRERLRKLVRKTVREMGITVLHVTHDSEDVWALADQVAVIHDGRLLQHGSPEEVFSCPKPGYVAGLVGAKNIFSGKVIECDPLCNSIIDVQGERIFSAGPSLSEGDMVTLSIRPEEIMVARGEMAVSSRNQIKLTIVDTERRGPLVWLTGEHGGLVLHAVVTVSAYETLELEEGGEAVFIFKARSVQILEGPYEKNSGFSSAIPDLLSTEKII